MATQPQSDIFAQLAAGQTTPAAPTKTSAAAPGDIFDTLAANPNGTTQQPSQGSSASAGGPTPEEQQLLASNPSYKYLPADPKFPNRPAGVYPTGPGNEWRNDPTMSQSPVDPELLKHTAQGAGYGALAAGSALAAPLADPAVTAAIAHLGKVKAILDAARNIGLTTGGIGLGIKEARDLYKEFSK